MANNPFEQDSKNAFGEPSTEDSKMQAFNRWKQVGALSRGIDDVQSLEAYKEALKLYPEDAEVAGIIKDYEERGTGTTGN